MCRACRAMGSGRGGSLACLGWGREANSSWFALHFPSFSPESPKSQALRHWLVLRRTDRGLAGVRVMPSSSRRAGFLLVQFLWTAGKGGGGLGEVTRVPAVTQDLISGKAWFGPETWVIGSAFTDFAKCASLSLSSSGRQDTVRARGLSHSLLSSAP